MRVAVVKVLDHYKTTIRDDVGAVTIHVGELVEESDIYITLRCIHKSAVNGRDSPVSTLLSSTQTRLHLQVHSLRAVKVSTLLSSTQT